MNRSGKYDLMRQEYVTGEDGITYASLGQKYGRSVGSIGPIAKREGWIAMRASYREVNAIKVRNLSSEQYAERVIELQGTFLDTLETTLDKYHAAVRDGTITPNPTDVAKLMATAREIIAKPSAPESPEAAGGGIRISESLGHELFRLAEAAARSRLDPGSVEGSPRPKLVGSS